VQTGAKRPRPVPAWLAKLIAGRPLVEWSTTLRGASNERVKRELGWTPRYASWRRGFQEALAP
jgi:2-alkyl-3-oxoalkanoate reductase